MAQLLKLREAARLIGVSPGRLYHAMAASRLTAAPGGGPGKPTLVSLEVLQTFCRSEGLRVPQEGEIPKRAERPERAERSINPVNDALALQALETLTVQYLAQIMARQSDYIEAFLREELSHLVARVAERVVDRVAERLAERFTGTIERSERAERTERSATAIASSSKADLLTRLRTLREAGLSFRQIADLLNAEGVPTLSGKGRWQKGTIGNLLARGHELP